MGRVRLPRRLTWRPRRQLWIRRYLNYANLLAANADAFTLPTNLLPDEDATFSDGPGWTVAGDWTIADDVASKVTGGSASNLDYNVTIPAGDWWLGLDITDTNGNTAGLRAQFTGGAGGGSGNLLAVHVEQGYARLYSTPGQTRLRINGLGAWSGSIDNVQLYNVDDIRARPADIYGLWGQSNIVGLLAEPVSDADWMHPEVEYWAGSTSTNYGAVANALCAAYDPLQHLGSSGNNRGVGPGMEAAKRLLRDVTGSRRIVLVACGENNTSLTTADTDWNAPNGSNYTASISAMQAALAACPAGSEIKGIFWSQGENDDGPSVGTNYPPAFSTLVSSTRSALSLPDLPFVIIGPNPEYSQALNGGLLMDAQERMDQDSGDASAISRVKYVASPTGYQAPDLSSHFTAQGQRLRGELAGAQMLAIPQASSGGAFSSGFSGGYS